MTQFDKILEARLEKIKKVLSAKATEYATTKSRYHNFEVAARKLDCSPEQSLMGMKVKHDVSVDDLVEWAATGDSRLTAELIDEKIGDSINYLILLEGMLKNRLDLDEINCPVCGGTIAIGKELIVFSKARYGTLLTCGKCGAELQYFDNELKIGRAR